MEYLRRVLLLLGVTVSTSLFFFVPVQPWVTVEFPDFASMQQVEPGYSDEGRFLRQLPLGEYVQEKMANSTIDVSGEAWEQFFESVDQLRAGSDVPFELSQHVNVERLRDPEERFVLFYRPTDAPIQEITNKLVQLEGRPAYLGLGKRPAESHLVVRYIDENNAAFEGGAGLLSASRPSSSFIYPYRWHAAIALLAGITAWLFLPRTKHSQDSLFYSPGRIAAADVFALGIFTCFYGLPMFFLGGILQLFEGPGFLIAGIMWGFAGMGVWLLLFMSEYAAYQILVDGDAIQVDTARAHSSYPFNEIQSWQPVVQRPPRWLVALLWLASIFSKGARSYQTAGQAMILEGTATSGIALALKGSSVAYLWVSSEMGRHAEPFRRKLLKALQVAGVPEESEPTIIYGMSPVDGSGEQFSRLGRLLNTTSLFCLTLPLLFLTTVALLKISTGDDFSLTWYKRHAEEQESTVSPDDFVQPDWLVWDHPIQLDSMTVGQTLLPLSEDNFLIGATTWPAGGGEQSVAVIQADAQGQIAWSERFGNTRINQLSSITACRDAGFLLLGHVADRTGIYSDQQLCVRRINQTGKLIWELLWEGTNAPSAVHATERADGMGFDVWGISESQIHRLTVSMNGTLENVQTVDFTNEVVEAKLNWLTVDGEGGLFVTGEATSDGDGFRDLLLMKLAESGELLWKRLAGGKRREFGLHLIPTPSGEAVAVGVQETGPATGRDLYCVKFNGIGELIWQRSLPLPGDQWPSRIAPLTDVGYLIVADSRPQDSSYCSLVVMGLDVAGTPLSRWELKRSGQYFHGQNLFVYPDHSLLILGSHEPQEFHEQILLIRTHPFPGETPLALPQSHHLNSGGY